MSGIRSSLRALWPAALGLAVCACGGGGGAAEVGGDAQNDVPAEASTDVDADGDPGTDGDVDADVDAAVEADVDEDIAEGIDGEPEVDDDADDADGDAGPDAERSTFVVVTFNTGTTEGTTHDVPGDVYDSEKSGYSDTYYGDGLAWLPAVEAVQSWFAVLQPDVVAFQEIFYSGDCPSIPAVARTGFVCETWTVGDPTVAQVLLGSGYQVACNPGKNDKCLAVRRDFGTIRQCGVPDFCIEGLDGAQVDGCGSGSRVGRGTIDLVGGGELTVVTYHGSSGVTSSDADCRAAQVRQVFENLDGAPAANGARNVILGDFNIDPCRVPGFLDASSEAWNDNVGGGSDFRWVSPCGPFVPPTYAGVFNIDHVVSDAFDGTCYVPGVTAGYDVVYAPALFDHKPLVCEIGEL